jgi:hypothetical protein
MPQRPRAKAMDRGTHDGHHKREYSKQERAGSTQAGPDGPSNRGQALGFQGVDGRCDDTADSSELILSGFAL